MLASKEKHEGLMHNMAEGKQKVQDKYLKNGESCGEARKCITELSWIRQITRRKHILACVKKYRMCHKTLHRHLSVSKFLGRVEEKY